MHINTQTHTSHFGQVRTSVDPRLITKAVNEFPKRYGISGYRSIRNSFNSLVKADSVLKDVDLSNTVAVVTGGNSGLGMWYNILDCVSVVHSFGEFCQRPTIQPKLASPTPFRTVGKGNVTNILL